MAYTQTHCLLLSTTMTAIPSATGQPIAYCIDATNKANATFFVNWGKVFDNLYENQFAYIRVRSYFTTKGNTSITWDANIGTLRANLPDLSTFQTNNGMLILGTVIPQDLGITITGTPHKLLCDTTATMGSVCGLPRQIQTLNIQVLDMSEALQTNVMDYQLLLYFDVYSAKTATDLVN